YLLRLTSSTANVVIKNNVFSSSFTTAAGTATVRVEANSTTGFVADYNDYYSSASTLGTFFNATPSQTLAGWQAASGQDSHSISSNPLWYEPTAPIEDFHPKSSAGRWNGVGFTNDTADSLTIDAADPAEAFANEQSPNGGRANQGSYGNTTEASRTGNI